MLELHKVYKLPKRRIKPRETKNRSMIIDVTQSIDVTDLAQENILAELPKESKYDDSPEE